MIKCKYYRINLKDRSLLKQFNVIKNNMYFKNHDEAMIYLLNRNDYVSILEYRIKDLEMKIKEYEIDNMDVERQNEN